MRKETKRQNIVNLKLSENESISNVWFRSLSRGGITNVTLSAKKMYSHENKTAVCSAHHKNDVLHFMKI